MRNYIWAGILGGLIVGLIVLMAFAIYSPIHSAPIYMLNTNCITDSIQHQMLDSLKCTSYGNFNRFRREGITP